MLKIQTRNKKTCPSKTGRRTIQMAAKYILIIAGYCPPLRKQERVRGEEKKSKEEEGGVTLMGEALSTISSAPSPFLPSFTYFSPVFEAEGAKLLERRLRD